MPVTRHSCLPTIMHLVGTYLFRTGSWIYPQVAFPTRYRTAVLCIHVENQDIFPLEKVYALYQHGKVRRVWEKVALRLLGTFPLFVNAVRTEKGGLLHAHFGPMGYMHGLPLARKTGLSLIVSFYGLDAMKLPRQEPAWRQRYHRLFDESALFLAEGEHMRQRLIALGCPSEKAVVQHLGVDLAKVPYRPRRQHSGPVQVLVAGSFTEKKGFPYAVEAFARLAQKPIDVCLTVVGDARPDYPEDALIKCRILEVIERYHVQEQVTFTGYVPYPILLSVLEEYDILMAPSVRAADGDAEGGAPVIIIEASASGMPVISTHHCDIPEIILDGVSGYLVAERDVDALTDRLEYLVGHPEQWEVLGAAGRRHIESEYNARKQVAKLESLYDRVIAAT